jgi:hypothetical protein
MARIATWRHLMRQTVLIAPRTGDDRFGVPAYGSDVPYRGRLVGKRRLVLNQLGHQVVSSQTLYLASGDNVLPDARVTLSTGDVGSTESWALTPKILATGRYPDETGRFLYSALFLA